MARIEHFNDPQAPRANSLVVAVTVFVMDEHDRVLLVRPADSDRWELPGGVQQVGEYITESAVRTTRAQAGADVEVTGLVGVYSNPHHVVECGDGEVRQQFSLCFRARYLGGAGSGGAGIGEVRWVPSDALDDLPLHPSTRLRVDHGYNRMPQPYLG
jgi:ADP-ribose pyrophosphatase YjhB (NUDIX family)